MHYVGIDLHKKTITLCVVRQDRTTVTSRSFRCEDVERIDEFFRGLGLFDAAIEATAGYHWLVERIEPLARRIILAHPGKLRVIAESTCKTDKIDARILAQFLALDMLPRAYRPTPRQRDHRTLIRFRQYLQRQKGAIQVKIRRIVSDYNADRRDLFSQKGLEHLAGLRISEADRFVVTELLDQWRNLVEKLKTVAQQIRQFTGQASAQEQASRKVLGSIPGVGEVTTEVVIAELGDVSRFGSARQVVAYAGLAPGRRESAGKAKDLGITKAGSKLLRWVLVEGAWRLVTKSRHWGLIYERLKVRRGARRAIVAIARRLLGVMVALLRSGKEYKEPLHAAA